MNVWDRNPNPTEFDSIARFFKVSTLVAARRSLELGLITKDEFFLFYDKYKEKLKDKGISSSGGNFYATTGTKLGNLFSRIIISEVKSGNILYRDACRLTGLKGDTFNKYMDYIER